MHFKDVTKIEDAVRLYDKLKRDATNQQFDPSNEMSARMQPAMSCRTVRTTTSSARASCEFGARERSPALILSDVCPSPAAGRAGGCGAGCSAGCIACCRLNRAGCKAVRIVPHIRLQN